MTVSTFVRLVLVALVTSLGVLTLTPHVSAQSGSKGECPVCPKPSTATQQEVQQDKKDDFVDLLEGNNLAQFRGYRNEKVTPAWSVKDNVLSFNGRGKDDILTKETYDNFELQVEWKISKGGNSGIMFHVTLGDAAPYFSGPEFQILDDARHPKAKANTTAGALYALYPPVGKQLAPNNGWNQSRIVVDGKKMIHYLNGTKVVEAELGSDDWNKRLAASKFKDWPKFAKASEGHICFQSHGSPVQFRNIRIRRIESSAPQASSSEASDKKDEADAPEKEGDALSSDETHSEKK